MEDSKKTEQGFIIDRLTNSILNTVSGDSFQTEVIRLGKSDLKYITKSKAWNFNWKQEFDEIKKEVLNFHNFSLTKNRFINPYFRQFLPTKKVVFVLQPLCFLPKGKSVILKIGGTFWKENTPSNLCYGKIKVT